MMKSAFAMCLVAALLCAADARELLRQSSAACTTYPYSGRSSVEKCPCSGTSKHGRNNFKGNFKMKQFHFDQDKQQIMCDGEVTGTYDTGHKQQHCESTPITIPITVETCGTRTCASPGGSCKSWLNAPSPRNSGQGCGSLVKLTDVLNCEASELLGKNSKHCGASTCPLVSIYIGDENGCEFNGGGFDVTLARVELLLGGYHDNDILGELVCVLGNLLEIEADLTLVVDVLNLWLGGCYNNNECSLLSEVDCAVESILSALDVTAAFGFHL